MNIIITGGNSKIGRVLIPLLSIDHSLSVNSRSSSSVPSDRHILINAYDLTNKRAVKSLLSKSFDFFGKIDAVINLTGYLSEKEMLNFNKKEFFLEMEINLFSYFLLCRCLYENIRLRSCPVIVINFTIQNPERVYKKITFHNIAKSGLENLSRSFNNILSEYGIFTKCIRLPNMQEGKDKIPDLLCIVSELLSISPEKSREIIDLDSQSFGN